ncbi:hypothetical protein V8C37DRAFT_295027 [Trichoderma ceciliae]
MGADISSTSTLMVQLPSICSILLPLPYLHNLSMHILLPIQLSLDGRSLSRTKRLSRVGISQSIYFLLFLLFLFFTLPITRLGKDSQAIGRLGAR